LLEKLEGAETVAQYQYFTEKLEASAKRAKEAKDPEVPIKILSALLRHLHPLSPKPGELQRLAKEALDRIADLEGIHLLIERFCDRKATNDELAFIFTGLGPKAIPPLLERLKEEEHLSARRRLIHALIQQGASAVPFLLQVFDDPRWYVVRNAALILGHVGGEEAVGPLRRQLRHPDYRVRREVILALGRIGGPQVSGPLLEALQDQDPVACQYAVAALSALKERRAVPALIEIARAAPDVALQQAAIAALGRIGGEEALHTLVDLLKKRSFLRTAAHEEMRAQAAAALGVLGTEEALEALKAEAERSRGKVLKACQEALEKLSRGEERSP
ncbi:MAG: HEAT repeat domain-containing protein, partial [Candidatus Methylomirabilales bacterium]